MTDAEMIAALAGKLDKDELMALASRLNRKKPKELVPTDDEAEQFERLWMLRRQFTKRPGDPKRPALLKFCRRMREKPVAIEEIEHGIRCEYSAKKERPEHYCQMETFMSQRRWENYDWAAVKMASERGKNVVPIRSNYKPAFMRENPEWEAKRAEQ